MGRVKARIKAGQADIVLQLLHSSRNVFADGLDVMLARYDHMDVPQNGLHHLVCGTEPVEVRRQSTAKRMPAVPLR